MKPNLSRSALLAVLLGSSALVGCDDVFLGGGDADGSVEITSDVEGMVFAGGVVELRADYSVDEEARWNVTFTVDGGSPSLPELGADEDGTSFLRLGVDTTTLDAGEHEIAVLLWIEGEEYEDVVTIRVEDGIVLRSFEASDLGYDGDFGGDPEPEVHLYTESGGWLGCAGAGAGSQFRAGGSPLLRSALEGQQVYVVLSENDDEAPCAEPSFGASDVFGNADDNLGSSEAFTLEEGVAASTGSAALTLGFGRGY